MNNELSSFVYPGPMEWIRRCSSVNNKQNETESAINSFDSSLLEYIFRKLPKLERTALPLVSKRWKEIATSRNFLLSLPLKDVSLNIRIIDKSVWERFFDVKEQQLSFSNETPFLNKKMLDAAEKIFPHIERKRGVTLLTIPRGLTFRKLMEMASSLRLGERSVRMNVKFLSLVETLNQQSETTSCYHVVLSNGGITGTEGGNFHAIEEALEARQMRIPSILHVAAQLILTHLENTVSEQAPSVRMQPEEHDFRIKCAESFPKTHSYCSTITDNSGQATIEIGVASDVYDISYKNRGIAEIVLN